MLLIVCALSRQLHSNKRRCFLYAKNASINLHCILYKMIEYLFFHTLSFAKNKPSNWWEIQLGFTGSQMMCYYLENWATNCYLDLVR